MRIVDLQRKNPLKFLPAAKSGTNNQNHDEIGDHDPIVQGSSQSGFSRFTPSVGYSLQFGHGGKLQIAVKDKEKQEGCQQSQQISQLAIGETNIPLFKSIE